MKFLNGKKTYLSAGLLVVFAVLGAILGELEPLEIGTYVASAVGLFGLGHKIDRSLTAKTKKK